MNKLEEIYVVGYTNGDREDMGKDQLAYASKFYIGVPGIADDVDGSEVHTSFGGGEKLLRTQIRFVFFYVLSLSRLQFLQHH